MSRKEAATIMNDSKMVPTIERDLNGQFTTSGKTNRNSFKTMFDSGLPVTKLEINDMKEKLKR